MAVWSPFRRPLSVFPLLQSNLPSFSSLHMFKRQPTIKPSTALRSSTRRQLLSILQQLYPLLATAPPDVLQAVVPDGLQQRAAVNSGGIKVLIYSEPDKGSKAGRPLWWEAGSDNGNWMNNKKVGSSSKNLPEIVPTIYTLWTVPNLLPILPTWPQVVDPALLGGSALMVPGLLPAPHTYTTSSTHPTLPVKNDLVIIVAYPSHVPQVLARMEMDVRDATQARAEGQKGKAVKVLHSYKDGLWELGGSGALPESVDALQSDGDAAASTSSSPVAEADQTLNDQAAGLSVSAEADEEEVRLEEASQPAPPPAATATFTTAEIDHMLYLALLSAIQASSSSEGISLPSPASSFYSTWVLSSRPSHWPPRPARGKRAKQAKAEGTPGSIAGKKMGAISGEEEREVDADGVVVAKSSYKKFARWIKAMDKEGLIKTKETRGELMIVEMNTAHGQVTSLSPFQTLSDVAAAAAASSHGAQAKDDRSDMANQSSQPADEGSSSTAADPSSTSGTSIYIEEVYSASGRGKDLFESFCLKGGSSDYHSAPTLRKAMADYILSQCTPVAKNQQLVVPDQVLISSLELGPSKGGTAAKVAPLKREELQKLFFQHCTVPHHRISRLYTATHAKMTTSSSAPPDLGAGESLGKLEKGAFSPPVKLSVKKRQGNKVVTFVTGLEQVSVSPKLFAGEVMRSLGTSVSVTALPSSTAKVKREEVLIQGDQTKAVVERLKGDNGVGKECIEIVAVKR